MLAESARITATSFQKRFFDVTKTLENYNEKSDGLFCEYAYEPPLDMEYLREVMKMEKEATELKVNRLKEKISKASLAIRDMFYSKQYKGIVPAADIAFIISGKARRWEKLYGKGIPLRTWKGILNDGFVESVVEGGRKFWKWIDYYGGEYE